MYESLSMGWSDVPGLWGLVPVAPCDAVRAGEKRCFVTDSALDQSCARDSGCVRLNEACETASGNAGGVWCCPQGQPSVDTGCGTRPGVTAVQSGIPAGRGDGGKPYTPPPQLEQATAQATTSMILPVATIGLAGVLLVGGLALWFTRERAHRQTVYAMAAAR